MATLYLINGTARHHIKPADGKMFSTQEAKELLGCKQIQVIDLNDKELLILDEEAKLKGSPQNAKVSLLFYPKLRQMVHGNVLLCKSIQI